MFSAFGFLVIVVCFFSRVFLFPFSSPPIVFYLTSRSVNMVRHPRGRYIVIPIAASGVATPEDKVTRWRCHP